MLPIFPGLSHRSGHCIFGVPGALRRGRRPDQEDAMSTTLMSLRCKQKISLRPSRRRSSGPLWRWRLPRRRRRCGFRLRLSHHRPLPGIDRRRLREGRLHDHLAESVRLYRAGAGRRQPAGQGRPVAGPDRRARFPSRARAGACRCRGVGGRGAQPRCADRAAAADHRTGRGRHRRRRSQSANSRRKNRPATTS